LARRACILSIGPCRRSSIAAAPYSYWAKIDEILAWEQRKETERDTKFVELGRYLCEVRAGQYWRLEELKCFDEFLERRFPGIAAEGLLPYVNSRTSAAAGEEGFEEASWAKGIELAKLARRGPAALRLCNLVAQSPSDADRRIQAGGREGTDGKAPSPQYTWVK
jgi:hypothetical protein